jgi:hypothetical protein
MLYVIGIMMLAAAGAILHDVPFLRFISAIMLISAGQTFLVLASKAT